MHIYEAVGNVCRQFFYVVLDGGFLGRVRIMI